MLLPLPVVLALSVAMPASFLQIGTGPAGGTVWQGPIPFRGLPGYRRPTVVYLPPGASARGRYPVVVLLQGFRGSPYEFVDGVNLPSIADARIGAGCLPPFVAVIPPAGHDAQYRGEWAGVWERYLVRAVLPWVRTHLPVTPDPSGWTLAGLSAGGYGAMDIGLRHPGLFGTLESWSGYFTAPRDGPLRGASANVRETHDPTLLVQGETPLLQRLGTRFFLSSGTTHDKVGARDAGAFSRELASLGLRHRLYLLPGGHDGRFWRAQLPAALGYALAPSSDCASR